MGVSKKSGGMMNCIPGFVGIQDLSAVVLNVLVRDRLNHELLAVLLVPLLEAADR